MSLSLIYPGYLWLLILVPLTLAVGLIGRSSGSHLRRWMGLSLRVILLITIILALAGIQLRLRSNQLTTVFVLDVSDSISTDEQALGEDFIRQSIQAMKSAEGQNQAALVPDEGAAGFRKGCDRTFSGFGFPAHGSCAGGNGMPVVAVADGG